MVEGQEGARCARPSNSPSRRRAGCPGGRAGGGRPPPSAARRRARVVELFALAVAAVVEGDDAEAVAGEEAHPAGLDPVVRTLEAKPWIRRTGSPSPSSMKAMRTPSESKVCTRAPARPSRAPATPSTPIIWALQRLSSAAEFRIRFSRQARDGSSLIPHFANDPGRGKDPRRREGVPVHGRPPAARPSARVPRHGRGRPDPVPLSARRSTCTMRVSRPTRPTRRAAWWARGRHGLSLPAGRHHGRSAPILIAGGGIGGLALALALAQQAAASIVLEQRDSFATAGAGIQLGPNGVRVLQRLGVAGRCGPLVGEPEAIRVHDGRPGGRWPRCRWALDRRTSRRALLGGAPRRPARGLARRRRGRAAHHPAHRLRARRPDARRGAGVQATSAAGDTADGPRARRRRRAVVERAGRSCPDARAASSPAPRRRAPSFRPPRGAPGDAGGRPVADAGRARRALSGAWRRRDRRRRDRRRGLAGPRLGAQADTAAPCSRACAASTRASPRCSSARATGANGHSIAWLRCPLVGRPRGLMGDAVHPDAALSGAGRRAGAGGRARAAACLAAQPATRPGRVPVVRALRRERANRVQGRAGARAASITGRPPLSWARDAVLELRRAVADGRLRLALWLAAPHAPDAGPAPYLEVHTQRWTLQL